MLFSIFHQVYNVKHLPGKRSQRPNQCAFALLQCGAGWPVLSALNHLFTSQNTQQMQNIWLISCHRFLPAVHNLQKKKKREENITHWSLSTK